MMDGQVGPTLDLDQVGFVSVTVMSSFHSFPTRVERFEKLFWMRKCCLIYMQLSFAFVRVPCS